jgi:hypothetical protein
MTACGGAMTTTNCVDTGSEAHDSVNATFEETAFQLEELGYSHEISSDGVLFSRGPAVDECDPRRSCLPPGPQLPLFSG